MTPRELQTRRVLEHSMEKIVAALPAEMQITARTSFYEHQIKQATEALYPDQQNELLLDR